MINKQEFWAIIKPELMYYNKTWRGETEADKKQNESTVLAMYFDSLKHAKTTSLQIAFDNHRAESNHWPKIAELLRYCPKLRQVKPEDVELTPSEQVAAARAQKKVMDEFSKPKAKHVRKSLREEMMRKLKERWPFIDWNDSAFGEWEKEQQLLD